MEKGTVEKFKEDGRPVWFLGRRTSMPIKARIVKICEDDSVGEYAKLEYICDDECVVLKSADVSFGGMYESKDDCIRFMFNHTVSYAGEYTNLIARRAIQNIAKKRWGIDLE